MANQNNLYNAERIISALDLLLTIMDGYELEYTEYGEDAYTDIIKDTISLYDNSNDDLQNVSVDVLEFSIDRYDIWKSMLSFFIDTFKNIDFSDEFPVCNYNDEELIFNWKDEVDILEYLSMISKEDVDALD